MLVEKLCREEEVGFVDLWGSFVGRADIYMKDGLHLSRKGAAVFADGLSAALDSGMGSVSNIFGSKHYLRSAGGNLEMPQAGQEATSTDKPITACPKNMSEAGYRCVCLNARSIVNKKNELNIMVEDTDPHIIGITESWANTDITDAELGLTGYVMFRRNRLGRRGGVVILYVKESIQPCEIKLEREADYDEAVWCKIVSGNSKLNIGLIYRSPNINEEDKKKCYKGS